MCTIIWWRTFIVIIMICPVSPLPVDHKLVQVKDPVTLICNRSCPGDDDYVEWMLSKKAAQLVSECRKGVCVEGEGFKNRTKPGQGNSSLHLNPVVYNDQGWYTCYCNNSELCKFNLEVVFPRPKSVYPGENVTLPCYAATDSGITDNDIFLQWEKDGELVVKLEKEEIRYGSGFEGRAFVSLSQYKTGDLSLTLRKVHQSDTGIYQCRHRLQELGEPEAINLSVNDPSESAASPQFTFPWYGWTLPVFAVIVFVCVGVFYRFYKLGKMCCKTDEAADPLKPQVGLACPFSLCEQEGSEIEDPPLL